jgi:hypothetical protein
MESPFSRMIAPSWTWTSPWFSKSTSVTILQPLRVFPSKRTFEPAGRTAAAGALPRTARRALRPRMRKRPPETAGEAMTSSSMGFSAIFPKISFAAMMVVSPRRLMKWMRPSAARGDAR